MEKVFVDTSGWVALFVANDENHERAVSIFEDLKLSKYLLHTSDYIIDETITTILFRGSHMQSVLAGEALFTSKITTIVHVAPDHLRNAWLHYRKYADKRFSFTDVTSFSIMQELKIRKAFAFDRNFLQAGFELMASPKD